MTEKKDVVEDLIDKSKPVLQNIGFGAVMGFCSGMAMKKVGRSLASVIGFGFIGLQLAATMGYIEIDWEKIRVEFVKKADTNEDGTLNTEDAKNYWKIFKKLMTHKLPSAGGFSFGFLYGVRNG